MLNNLIFIILKLYYKALKIFSLAKKFDAISESGGQSLVQVGNVLIVSGQGNDSHSRGNKCFFFKFYYCTVTHLKS